MDMSYWWLKRVEQRVESETSALISTANGGSKPLFVSLEPTPALSAGSAS